MRRGGRNRKFDCIIFKIYSTERKPDNVCLTNLSNCPDCYEQFYSRCVIYEHEHEQPVIYEECVTLNNA